MEYRELITGAACNQQQNDNDIYRKFAVQFSLAITATDERIQIDNHFTAFYVTKPNRLKRDRELAFLIRSDKFVRVSVPSYIYSSLSLFDYSDPWLWAVVLFGFQDESQQRLFTFNNKA